MSPECRSLKQNTQIQSSLSASLSPVSKYTGHKSPRIDRICIYIKADTGIQHGRFKRFIRRLGQQL